MHAVQTRTRGQLWEWMLNQEELDYTYIVGRGIKSELLHSSISITCALQTNQRSTTGALVVVVDDAAKM